MKRLNSIFVFNFQVIKGLLDPLDLEVLLDHPETQDFQVQRTLRVNLGNVISYCISVIGGQYKIYLYFFSLKEPLGFKDHQVHVQNKYYYLANGEFQMVFF